MPDEGDAAETSDDTTTAPAADVPQPEGSESAADDGDAVSGPPPEATGQSSDLDPVGEVPERRNYEQIV